MACKYTYKGITYNSKEEFINQVIDPQFLGKSNNIYSKLVKLINNLKTTSITSFGETKNKIDNKVLLNFISENGDAQQKFLAKLLIDKVEGGIHDFSDGIDVFIRKGEGLEFIEFGGSYSDSLDFKIPKLDINDNLNKQYHVDRFFHVVLHEYIHYATVSEIIGKKENKEKVSKLINIAKESGLSFDYGLTNEKEFVAEVLSNKDFQEKLSKIPFNTKQTLFDRFIEIISSIFGKSINNTLLKEAIQTSISLIGDYRYNRVIKESNKKETPKGSKTRRILELQSDLFQKGRDRKDLSTTLNLKKDNELFVDSLFEYNGDEYSSDEAPTPTGAKRFYYKNDSLITKEEYEKASIAVQGSNFDTNGNQFLQLLNKNNNWVTFFVKSIIQDSAKKGYEKVLFPSGNTASKVEGHTTLEEFKKQKEDKIKELENDNRLVNEIKTTKNFKKGDIIDLQGQEYTYDGYDEMYGDTWIGVRDDGYTRAFSTAEIESKIGRELENNNREIEQLKAELQRVETEGFGALKPIYNFYENTVTNILKKNFKVNKVTDEYGNTWNEVQLTSDLANKQINFSKSENTETLLDKELNKSLNAFIEKAGIEVNIVKYLKNREGKIDPTLSAEAITSKVANAFQKTINIVAGRDSFENRAEEVAHIFTAMLGYEHPLYKAMEKRIINYAEYQEVIDTYPELTDNKDVVFEAIGKVIKNNMKDLLEKKANYTLQNWWDSVLRVLGKLVGDIFTNPYKKAAYAILEGNIAAYNQAEIQANSKSRLEELDDTYKANTHKYHYYKPKTRVNKNLVSLEAKTIQKINQKEIDKVAITSDIDLNTSTIQELKEVLRDTVSEYAYVDAAGMTFLAEQVQKGNWKLSCSL